VKLTKVWPELTLHHQSLAKVHLQDLFMNNPQRFSEFSVSFESLLLDYSKQKVTQETIWKLCALAEERDLKEQIHRLFSGEIVNSSEQRQALHTALRDRSDTPLLVKGHNIKPEMKKVLAAMDRCVTDLRSGHFRGATGKPIKDVISLGIGGSDLGPAMVNEALHRYKTTDLKIHFISNVDGWSLAALLKHLDPATTLCIINSKTFTTPETLQNAETIKVWFQKALGQDIQKHLIATTAYPERAQSFGVAEENIFEFWDFIGGRYSVWSSVGLPIALALGMENFKDFLAGANSMDQHFYSAPFDKNMPVLMALIGIWNINFWGCKTLAVLPYDDGLKQLPDYLQQLEMESNGKKADKEKGFVPYDTAPVIWGGVGCNGQHAYMQLLHQGTQVIPVDFLIAAEGHPDFEDQQKLLVASCLSQSKALMEGSKDKLALGPLSDAKLCEGNRPSNTLIYSKLTPKVLGSLIALYEHKVFTQAVLWGINPFDQWGVELGKKLVNEILPHLGKSSIPGSTDSSTAGLIEFFQKNRFER